MAQRNADARGDSLTDHAAARLHDAVDRVAETANSAERDVRDAAARATQKAKDVREQTSAAAEQSMANLRAYVAENPLVSAGIAFAAGLFLSSLMRR